MIADLLKRAAYRAGFSLRRLRGVKTHTGQIHGTRIGNDGAALLRAIHARDPYEGFPFADHPMDAAGWGSDSPAFAELIERTRPALIIEVGTWKGGSALEMAAQLDRLGLGKSKILCVDTWLGALEMWGDHSDKERYGALELKHGYPQVYYQFLANVCHKQATARIIPFPLPSITAAQWLSMRSVRAELIYLDGSHEEEDVYADLSDYWDLLAAPGILFGDDYDWTGVKMAVDRFVKEKRLVLHHLADKWYLEKSAA